MSGNYTVNGNFIVNNAIRTLQTMTVDGNITINGSYLRMEKSTYSDINDRQGSLLIHDETGFKPTKISGDLTIDENGVATIRQGRIVNSDIAPKTTQYTGIDIRKTNLGIDTSTLSWTDSNNNVLKVKDDIF